MKLFKKQGKTIVGLTGGVASGKSFILSVFKKLGADIIDSDKAVHDILRKNKCVIDSVVERFGRGVVREGNGIDRKALRRIVFNNRKELRWLEALVHPVVLSFVKNRVKVSKKAVIVVDVPLLFEKNWGKYFDYIVTAFCARSVQVKRLIKRDKLGIKEAGRVISLQMPLAKKAKRSDFAIDTNDSKLQVSRDAKRVFEEITRGSD